jgi:hypothetical protein
MQLDLRTNRISVRNDDSNDVGLRHGYAISRCLPRFRSSGNSLLPVIGNPSSIRERICLRSQSPRLSRLYRSFSGGPLGPVRPDSPCSTVELRAHWTGQRCCGHVFRNHLRRRSNESNGVRDAAQRRPVQFSPVYHCTDFELSEPQPSLKENLSPIQIDPNRDIYTLYSAIVQKRWGCRGGYHR